MRVFPLATHVLMCERVHLIQRMLKKPDHITTTSKHCKLCHAVRPSLKMSWCQIFLNSITPPILNKILTPKVVLSPTNRKVEE